MEQPAATSSTTSEMPASAGSTRTDSFPDHAFVAGIHGDVCMHSTLHSRGPHYGQWLFCLRPENDHLTVGELMEAFGS
jgi:hypothetical protein